MFIVGLLAVGHFVVIQIAFEEWFWLVVGLMFFPVIAALWPFVAWAFGLLGGGWMIVFYVILGTGVALSVNEQRVAEPY